MMSSTKHPAAFTTLRALIVWFLRRFDLFFGLLYERFLRHVVEGVTTGIIVLVEKILPEVGEEVSTLVHFDKLVPVRLVSFERFQLSVRCDSFYTFGFLLFLVIRHQIPVFRGCFLVFRS